MRTGGPVEIWAGGGAGQRLTHCRWSWSSQARGTSVQAGAGLFCGSPDRSSLSSSDQAHPPTSHPTLLSPSCPYLGISAFSARLHAEYWMPGLEKAGGPTMRSRALYVLFCPQEQGRDAVLDSEDQLSSCHLLSTRLPSSCQLHEEVLSTLAALVYHSPLPGINSWG